mmetsp:Transcript_123905/g.358336  ORF Transcript_123905/g.358336 Transcript_123905/m.358336 type:complete len:501 (+) Transcript_123905:61-1563(+)
MARPFVAAVIVSASVAVGFSPRHPRRAALVEDPSGCGAKCHGHGALLEGLDGHHEPGPPHPLWEPRWDLLGGGEVPMCCFMLFFSGIFCAAAGVGGGGVFVAVLLVAGRLTPHDAIPMSKAIVFFGAVASLLVNLRKSGLGTEGSTIDIEVCKLVVPAALMGTFLGVLLNWHISDMYITSTLAFVLVGMTAMVTRIALQQYVQETRAALEPPLPEQQIALGAKPPAEAIECILAVGLLLIVIVAGTARHHINACARDMHFGNSIGLDACSHPFVHFVFGRGGMEPWFTSPLSTATIYAMMDGIPLFSCAALGARSAYDTIVAAPDRAAGVLRVVIFQSMALVAGILAGLVGIGGGLIFSPFFVVVGMDPAIAVGSSSACVLFTSSSTTMQYAFTDRIILSLAVLYGIAVLSASFVGTMLVHKLKENFPLRKSYITLIVAMSLAASAILVVIKLVSFLHAENDGPSGATPPSRSMAIIEAASLIEARAPVPHARALVRRGP